MNDTRFDVQMSPELAAQFADLSCSTGYTRAEVFRRALALYARAIELRNAGGRILLESAHGATTELTGL